MKIAVIGAGAIGNLIAGYLKFKDEDIALIGKAHSVDAIKTQGLVITGSRGTIKIDVNVSYGLDEKADIVILTVKTQDCEKAIKDNLRLLKDSIIVTTQNGVQADSIVAKYIPLENIISSVVMFGATYLEPGKITHNFEGPWILGSFFGKSDQKLSTIGTILKKAFPVAITQDIKGMKYLKIFLNANNCIPGILGVSMQEAFSDPEISRIGIAIWKEGLDIIFSAGIKLVSLPDFPVERLIKLTSMPHLEAAKIFSGIMLSLSPEPLYGSILQSIKRNRPSEIEYINGEFVKLAKQYKCSAPLNEALVNLVYRVEITKKFLTKEQLFIEIKNFLH